MEPPFVKEKKVSQRKSFGSLKRASDIIASYIKKSNLYYEYDANFSYPDKNNSKISEKFYLHILKPSAMIVMALRLLLYLFVQK
jgi:hypothetical protein